MLGGRVLLGRGIAAAFGGAWALAVLTSCSAAPAEIRYAPQAQGTVHADPTLFAAAYRAILSHYIDPLTADSLAMAGLQNAMALDPTLSVVARKRPCRVAAVAQRPARRAGARRPTIIKAGAG